MNHENDFFSEKEKKLLLLRWESLRQGLRGAESLSLIPPPARRRSRQWPVLGLPLAAAALLFFVLQFGLSRAGDTQIRAEWASIVSDLWDSPAGFQETSKSSPGLMENWNLLPDVNEIKLADPADL